MLPAICHLLGHVIKNRNLTWAFAGSHNPAPNRYHWRCPSSAKAGRILTADVILELLGGDAKLTCA
eukprot:8115973-Karenia_brevis.AAC.1